MDNWEIGLEAQTCSYKTARRAAVCDQVDHPSTSALHCWTISAGNAFAYASAHFTR
jgi:hypothetical protein